MPYFSHFFAQNTSDRDKPYPRIFSDNFPCFHPFTFTGKERDDETGYSYFGARYMDHELMTLWLSVDPMADKYPSISPYAYCAWNPVKLVDPDGKDIWEIDRKGNVIWKNKSENTMVYAVNKYGKRTGASLELSNDDILNQLKDHARKCQRLDAQGTPIKEGKLQAAVTTNKKNIVKLFKFASENTDVEWGIYSFKKGTSSKYGIATFQYDDETPSPSWFTTISVFNDVAQLECFHNDSLPL